MHRNALAAKINSYFAILLITIAGAGATLIIVHVAFQNTFVVLGTGKAVYVEFQ